jgi:exosome complex component RRP46
MMVPQLTTSPLNRADGSATFTNALFSVLAAVNGPVEVQRRDELPEEAAIEVNLRPSSGVGGPRERWLEAVTASVLRSVLLVYMQPRTLIQVTLQVMKESGLAYRKGRDDIALIPSLINAAFLALVDGGLPLDTTMSATLVAIDHSGNMFSPPGPDDLIISNSLHALAFNAHGELLLDESSGNFNMATWEKAVDLAKTSCMNAIASTGEDESMAQGGAENEPWLRQALEEKVRKSNAWRETT